MTPERQAEYRAHEALRDAIRQASSAQWDRRIAEGDDENGTRAPQVVSRRGGILIDYAVVAVFDSGQDHTVTAVLHRYIGHSPSVSTHAAAGRRSDL